MTAEKPEITVEWSPNKPTVIFRSPELEISTWPRDFIGGFVHLDQDAYDDPAPLVEQLGPIGTRIILQIRNQIENLPFDRIEMWHDEVRIGLIRHPKNHRGVLVPYPTVSLLIDTFVGVLPIRDVVIHYERSK